MFLLARRTSAPRESTGSHAYPEFDSSAIAP
jgi:hypothetical protein